MPVTFFFSRPSRVREGSAAHISSQVRGALVAGAVAAVLVTTAAFFKAGGLAP